MGTVFKKTTTKPLPAGAKVIVRKGQQLAEWINAKQKRRTAPVTIGNGHRRFDLLPVCTNYRQTEPIAVNHGQGRKRQQENAGSRCR